MESDIIQDIEETKIEEQDYSNSQKTETDYNAEIPGLEALPPETQEVVIEAYDYYDDIRERVDSYTKRTQEYLEKIPKATQVIERNIPPTEQRSVEIPLEKQQYIQDTVNIVELSKQIVGINLINLENLGTQKLLEFYQQFEKYGIKYNIEYIQRKLTNIQGVGEVKDYYSRTPKALLKRIQDTSLNRTDTPQLENTIYLNFLATETLNDYTYGASYDRKNIHDMSYRELRTICENTSIVDEKFLDMLDNKTKEINNSSKELAIEDECKRQISKKTGEIFIATRQNYIFDPLGEAKNVFFEGVAKRLNIATRSLEAEFGQSIDKMDAKQLIFSGVYELNKVIEKIVDSRNQYQDTLDSLRKILPQEVEINSLDNTHNSRLEHFIVTKSEIEEEQIRMKEILQSRRLFFHGIPTIVEGRLSIATRGLMSRKKQEQVQGWSRYNTPLINYSSRTEESRRQSVPEESEGVFFAHSIDGAYGKQEPFNHFVVGIPQGLAARNYAIGITGLDKGGESFVLDRDNPENGCLINPQDAYLFISTSYFETLKTEFNAENPEDFEKKARETWGDRLVISDQLPPESIEDLNLPQVTSARNLPTKFYSTDKFGKKWRVYKIAYS